jgi:hypothetical protein
MIIFIECVNYYDWWQDLLNVEIIVIDDEIYWMWKLFWSVIRLMIIFIECGNYYDWWQDLLNV